MGVLGSAFNPPHLGHLVLAQEARSRLGLSEVVLVPTGRAPHKEIDDDPGADARMEMARVAARADGRLAVSDVEVARDEPSFTYRTLELLGEERPGEELVFVMGADAAAGLDGWREPERILALARVAIAERRGVERSAVEGVLEQLGAGGRAEFLEMPEIEVSSSMVRERVATGKPIRWLVPDGVAALIAERRLYAGSGARRLQQA